MAVADQQHEKPPHPVAFDVAYPERLSRVRIFFKLLLAIPQFIAIYLLQIAMLLLTFLAWFAILFTGRYPKAFFEFTSGVLRWQAHVMAYVALLRDEYPPFSWEPGAYPLTLDIPRAERQSRFRLFIRWIALIPNQVVFWFVQVAWFFTSFLAWFMILFTGRYPRGLFKFAVGAIRWQMRSAAYQFLLRDEYPPYSVNADARPGNEVLSLVLGVPLFVLYISISFLPFLGMLGGGTQTVQVRGALTPSTISAEHPTGAANGVRVTLLGYDSDALAPRNVRIEQKSGYHLVSFRVRGEKDGSWPAFFTPYFFRLNGCDGDGYSPVAESSADNSFTFGLYWSRGENEGHVYFQVPTGFHACNLTYHAGLGRIRFVWQDEQATANSTPTTGTSEVHLDSALLFNSARLARERIRGVDGDVSVELMAYSSHADGPSPRSKAGPGERTVSFGAYVDLGTRGTIDEKMFAVVGCSGARYPVEDVTDAFRSGSRTLMYGFYRMPSTEDVCEFTYDHAGTHIRFMFDS